MAYAPIFIPTLCRDKHFTRLKKNILNHFDKRSKMLLFEREVKAVAKHIFYKEKIMVGTQNELINYEHTNYYLSIYDTIEIGMRDVA